jgi:sirohydrochlorin ferrochelatase
VAGEGAHFAEADGLKHAQAPRVVGEDMGDELVESSFAQDVREGADDGAPYALAAHGAIDVHGELRVSRVASARARGLRGGERDDDVVASL